ncbi:unnamed protein product [Adineta ricciae]|uniref:Uncharacterized protein n=1 Tax=Adineta ricciae TaxID=249248 RepID=A0A813XIS4_ADIRI|nr:unnamed protein product [Adineta ricciae]CAF0987468.1 unnamed protein product [Adineta ricciae]
MSKYLLVLISVIATSSIVCAIFLDDPCPTHACLAFVDTLANYPRQHDYEQICFDTAFTLQDISRYFGGCVHPKTRQRNPDCIIALANTIKNCVEKLHDIPKEKARHCCGRIMTKYSLDEKRIWSKMAKLFVLLLFLTIILAVDAIAFDFLHCKAATCQQFHYGLRKYPRRDQYVNVCFDTVNALQQSVQKHGKCFDEATKQFNKSCIFALANIMRSCVRELNDVPEYVAKHYCGRKLMQNCARQLGMERFPFKADAQEPVDDDY